VVGGFIFITTCDANVEELSTRVIRLRNERIRLERIASDCKEIAKMGPLRIEAERGITNGVIFAQFFQNSKMKDCEADASGQRVGVTPKNGAQIMMIAENVLETIKTQATQQLPLTLVDIEHHRENLRESLMSAYPKGLPP